MQSLTAPDRPPTADRPTARGRWIWIVPGVVTVGLLTLPVALFVTRPPGGNGGGQMVTAIPSSAVTIAATVSSLSIASYGAPIQVTTGPVRHVTIRESISYDQADGTAPAVNAQVSRGRLTLDAPSCATSDCSVGFTVTVPSAVAVTAESNGGPITVSNVTGANLDSGGGNIQAGNIDGPLTASAEGGTITVFHVVSSAGTSLDSGGGPINARQIDGPLTVSAEGGSIAVSGVSSAAGISLDSGGGPIDASQIDAPLSATAEGGGVTVNGLTGDLQANTGGGPFAGGSLTAGKASVLTDGGSAGLTFATAPADVMVDTGGGPATLWFDAAPTSVTVSTDGGSANLNVPGGPYTVTADSDGNSQTVDVRTAPAAPRSLTVSTDGGPLDIAPR